MLPDMVRTPATSRQILAVSGKEPQHQVVTGVVGSSEDGFLKLIF
jgi:hypothetical protein